MKLILSAVVFLGVAVWATSAIIIPEQGKIIRSFETEESCAALNETEDVHVTCSRRTGFQTTELSCQTETFVGTIATFSCKNYYKFSSETPTVTKICQFNGKWSNEENILHCELDCGIPADNIGPAKFIVHGKLSSIYKWPWNVNIYTKMDDVFKYICGGTLISRNVVLTAAHCMAYSLDPSLYRIVIGPVSSDLSENYENNNSQVMKVSKIETHREYSTRTMSNDIALMKLSSLPHISDFGRPVCFPFDDEISDFQLQTGTIGYVAGYGKDENDTLTTNLMELGIPVVSDEDCRKVMERSITNKQFCAGYTNGSSACHGDSGNGLVFLSSTPPKRYYLQGIVSNGADIAGTQRCDNSKYTVFTKVQDFRDWVSETLSAFEADK